VFCTNFSRLSTVSAGKFTIAKTCLQRGNCEESFIARHHEAKKNTISGSNAIYLWIVPFGMLILYIRIPVFSSFFEGMDFRYNVAKMGGAGIA
jgi:hypothetical protein